LTRPARSSALRAADKPHGSIRGELKDERMRYGVGGAEVTCGGGGEGGVEVGQVEGILLAAHR
jgi:hypothetical protein